MDRLLEFFGHEGLPKIEDAHWRRRLKPESREEWWKVHQATSTEELATDLASTLRNATLPILEEMSSESNLAVYWSTGQSEGLTDAQRLMNLLALLSEMGDHNDYVGIREELESKAKGKPWETTARSVLARAAEMQRDQE